MVVQGVVLEMVCGRQRIKLSVNKFVGNQASPNMCVLLPKATVFCTMVICEVFLVGSFPCGHSLERHNNNNNKHRVINTRSRLLILRL